MRVAGTCTIFRVITLTLTLYENSEQVLLRRVKCQNYKPVAMTAVVVLLHIDCLGHL